MSVGFAASAREACSITDMLAEGDAALFRAKDDGRNRVVLAWRQPGRHDPGKVVRIAGDRPSPQSQVRRTRWACEFAIRGGFRVTPSIRLLPVRDRFPSDR